MSASREPGQHCDPTVASPMSPADDALAVEEALNLRKCLVFATPQPLKACGAQPGRAAETRVTREGPWATSTQQTLQVPRVPQSLKWNESSHLQRPSQKGKGSKTSETGAVVGDTALGGPSPSKGPFVVKSRVVSEYL